MNSSWSMYNAKKSQLMETMKQSTGSVVLQKNTSNLFRERAVSSSTKLDVRAFHGVIEIDVTNATADVEGMTTFDELVRETLVRGFMPAVVPQLKSITIGGAIAGLGIESSSYAYGFVHETVLEIDVLLADGSVVTASPTNKHKDLFFGFPNSFGTLGYVLRAKISLVPVQQYVHLRHTAFSNSSEFFQAIDEIAKTSRYQGKPVNFVDGVAFKPGEYVITTGSFSNEAGKKSDYTWLKRYYRSLQQRTTDTLTTADYLWRWDSDWFWCSKNIPGAQNPLLRFLFGKLYLRSTFYWKVMRLDRQYHLLDTWKKITRNTQQEETIIQDVEIPLENCIAFLHFFEEIIGITPVWLCPVRKHSPRHHFDLYDLTPKTTYINFGFWDTIKTTRPVGYYNKLIEAKVVELAGHKSLYSDAYYDRATFWKLYNKPVYSALKRKYDSGKKLKDLYDKCVSRL